MEISEEELAAKIKEAVEASNSALDAKNKALLGEIKKLKKGQEIDPAEVEKLQEKIDALEGELTTAQKQVKDQQKSFEKVQADLQAESGFTSKLLLDNGLSDALVKAGVATPLLPAVKALLSSQAKVVTDGENRKAMIGEKDLNTFITDWAASDEGKHYIQAPNNSGGGANGGQGDNTGVQTMKRNVFDGLSPIEQSKFSLNGGQLTD